jgi:hypothetical protein
MYALKCMADIMRFLVSRQVFVDNSLTGGMCLGVPFTVYSHLPHIQLRDRSFTTAIYFPLDSRFCA